MVTHMTQTISARSQADHGCWRRETPIAVTPRYVTDKKPFVVGNARALQPETPGCRHTATALRIAPSLDYMRAHLDQPITICALSAMVGLSQSSFFELFRKATQATPLQWFIRARMRRACELLERTNLPVKQIADQVGYEDPLYFSRAFKSVWGIPPTEYRARNERDAANPVSA
jgi:AraC-like DNA-binding protein